MLKLIVVLLIVALVAPSVAKWVKGYLERRAKRTPLTLEDIASVPSIATDPEAESRVSGRVAAIQLIEELREFTRDDYPKSYDLINRAGQAFFEESKPDEP